MGLLLLLHLIQLLLVVRQPLPERCYSIPLTGGCGTVNATTNTVDPASVGGTIAGSAVQFVLELIALL
jgi:hypothetical protein